MDVFSKDKRSEVMSRIRGRDNKSTERRMAALLRAHGIAGWKLHPADVPGHPDIYFPVLRVAIFLDGCFWHACGRCFQMPVGNNRFWRDKLLANVRRDRKVSRLLRRSGVKVWRIWEHDLERKRPRIYVVLALLKRLTVSPRDPKARPWGSPSRAAGARP